MKCTVPECNNEHRTKGYCNMHYERLRKKGDVNWQPPKPIERFMKFIKINETGCWVWQGSKGNGIRNKGYGYFNNGIKNVIAHRWSYSFFKGVIPKGLTVHHIIPKSLKHSIDNNKVVLCRQCHSQVHTEGWQNFVYEYFDIEPFSKIVRSIK